MSALFSGYEGEAMTQPACENLPLRIAEAEPVAGDVAEHQRVEVQPDAIEIGRLEGDARRPGDGEGCGAGHATTAGRATTAWSVWGPTIGFERPRILATP